MKSEPARWAKPGARILHLYGLLVPSLERILWVDGKIVQLEIGDVRHEINGHFSFRRFDGAVGFARWHCVTLAENLDNNGWIHQMELLKVAP